MPSRSATVTVGAPIPVGSGGRVPSVSHDPGAGSVPGYGAGSEPGSGAGSEPGSGLPTTVIGAPKRHSP